MLILRSVIALVFTLALVSCQTPAYQEQGWASYIADSYAGRMTSSGYVYDPRYCTAAHNTLPFGTEVTVKNLYNGRSVKAVVTDRFPYYQGRVVNLSSAAASYIGMPRMQLAQVQVTAQKIPQGGYAPQQSYPQQNYTQQSYAPQQSYAQPRAYQPQPVAQQPYYPQPQQQQVAAPTYRAPGYPSQPAAAPTPAPSPAPVQQAARPSFFQRLGGSSTPAAPAYQGGSGPPPGLNTF